MKLTKYTFAATELLLIAPAVLFMTALFVRNLQPQQYEPAHTAQEIVNWYASQPHLGLWVLLMALPLMVMVTGCVLLVRRWRSEAELRKAAHEISVAVQGQLATFLVAAATLTAGGILSIVALHVLTD